MNKTLYYLFDPLCGWCYGAGKAVKALVDVPGLALRLLPSGLFSGEGARSMDADFAEYAWENDQRIEQLTGQHFSERYRSEVLTHHQQMFDSGPATAALTAVELTMPERELETLTAIQHARYLDGRDITQIDTLVAILLGLGLEPAAARVAQLDTGLLAANRARVDNAQALLREFGARGVPTFILEKDGKRQLLQSNAIFSNPQAFIGQVAEA